MVILSPCFCYLAKYFFVIGTYHKCLLLSFWIPLTLCLPVLLQVRYHTYYRFSWIFCRWHPYCKYTKSKTNISCLKIGLRMFKVTLWHKAILSSGQHYKIMMQSKEGLHFCCASYRDVHPILYEFTQS